MSKEIQLTQGKVAIVDDEDYEYLNQFKWHYHRSYAARSVRLDNGKGKVVLMHREILGLTDTKDFTDHISHETCDNRRQNLRVCTNSKNQMNSLKDKTFKGNPTSSKFKGVTWFKRDKKWQSQITKDKKYYYLGRFNTEEEAAEVYNKKSIELFGEFNKIV